MCCTSATRCWLFFILILWLLLACARQVFDLIGKLWIPVIFNLLQILSCINGLFAAGQQRLSLLIALAVSSLVSVAYNVVLLLWYAGVLGDPTQPLLSAGLPYSHSFFLRYTPFCKSHFNLTTSQWVQQANCVVPYHNVEGMQALVHILIALVTILLALLLFCKRRAVRNRKLADFSGSSGGGSGRTGKVMPSLEAAMVYGEGEVKKNSAVPRPPDSINDISSGYMNSSYETVDRQALVGRKEKGTEKRRKQPQKQTEMVPQRPKSQPPQTPSEYSSITSKSLTNSSVGSNSRLASFKKKKVSKRHQNRSVSPIRQNSVDDGFSEEEEEGTVARQYSKMRSKSANGGRRPPSMAEQRLSQAALEQMRRESSRLARSPVARQDSNEYLEYIRTDKNLSGNTNTTSLISFDPKSNTLIRVHEHITHNDNDDDDRFTTRSDSNAYKEVADVGVKLRARRTTSQDSVPSIQAPVLNTNHHHQLQIDSGHPSSSSGTNSISPDWSQGGITHVTQRPAMSPPLPPLPPEPVSPTVEQRKSIIGYDPALCDAVPPLPPRPPQGLPPPTAAATAFSSSPHFPTYGISLMTEIPLRSDASKSSGPPTATTRFNAVRNYANPSADAPTKGDEHNGVGGHYYAPDDIGLDLASSTASPPLQSVGGDKGSATVLTPTGPSTQFDAKPPTATAIIMSQTGLLV